MLASTKLEDDTEPARGASRVMVGAITVLIAIYAPFALFTDLKLGAIGFPGIRAIAIWLTLPGFGLGVFAKPDFDDTGVFITSGITTIALAYFLWRLTQRSVPAMFVAFGLALAVSVPTAFFVQRAFAS